MFIIFSPTRTLFTALVIGGAGFGLAYCAIYKAPHPIWGLAAFGAVIMLLGAWVAFIALGYIRRAICLFFRGPRQ